LDVAAATKSSCQSRNTYRLRRETAGIPGNYQSFLALLFSALFVSRDVFRSAKREHALDTGHPQRGINLTQPRHGLLGLIEPASAWLAAATRAAPAQLALLAEPLLRPRRGLVIVAGPEVDRVKAEIRMWAKVIRAANM
jgi:hypothetical protein